MSLPILSRLIRSAGSGWSKSLLALAGLFALAALVRVAPVGATPSLGQVAQTLAFGVAEGGISGHMQINKGPNGKVSPWQLQLQAQGDTDYHVLRLVLSPGGHSGWHSHPGLLVGSVITGQVDFYDANCQSRTIPANHVYTEDDAVHAIVNSGTVDAELYLTFLVKHGAPRRLDEPAPACADETPIP
jgi:hypothetical protein